MKVDITGLIARRVEIGYVRRDQLLPGAEQIHVVLKMNGGWIEHAETNAGVLPKGFRPVRPKNQVFGAFSRAIVRQIIGDL